MVARLACNGAEGAGIGMYALFRLQQFSQVSNEAHAPHQSSGPAGQSFEPHLAHGVPHCAGQHCFGLAGPLFMQPGALRSQPLHEQLV